MKKILVLCQDNACRSQMAEGYLNFYAGNKAIIYSAGIQANGLNPFAVKVMTEDNIDISSNSSKQHTKLDSTDFDYLIKVCPINESEIASLNWKKVYQYDILDPAETVGDEEYIMETFRATREIIKKSILQFIGKELISEAKAEEAIS